MKFGIREVTDIVFKTKTEGQQVGGATYPQYAPVFVVNSAKMTSMENAVATVYAQGGRGNPRLLAWDGDRTATFKFEDALTTNDGLSILSGAGVATGTTFMARQSHIFTTAQSTFATFAVPTLKGATYYTGRTGYPYALVALDSTGDLLPRSGITGITTTMFAPGALNFGVTFYRAGVTPAAAVQPVLGAAALPSDTFLIVVGGSSTSASGANGGFGNTNTFGSSVSTGSTQSYIFNYYVDVDGKQLQVEAGKFAGYYYIEANTLFRDLNGTDHPAQITIPKGKVKSNFTLTMSPTGDPSTFSFEVDCLPDITRFVTDKKVLYTLDILTADANELN